MIEDKESWMKRIVMINKDNNSDGKIGLLFGKPLDKMDRDELLEAATFLGHAVKEEQERSSETIRRLALFK